MAQSIHESYCIRRHPLRPSAKVLGYPSSEGLPIRESAGIADEGDEAMNVRGARKSYKTPLSGDAHRRLPRSGILTGEKLKSKEAAPSLGVAEADPMQVVVFKDNPDRL